MATGTLRATSAPSLPVPVGLCRPPWWRPAASGAVPCEVTAWELEEIAPQADRVCLQRRWIQRDFIQSDFNVTTSQTLLLIIIKSVCRRTLTKASVS